MMPDLEVGITKYTIIHIRKISGVQHSSYLYERIEEVTLNSACKVCWIFATGARSMHCMIYITVNGFFYS